MQDTTVGIALSLTVPTGATNLLIVHEWGDITVDYVAVTGGGTYNWTPDSIGVHAVYFINTVSVTTVVSSTQSKLDITRRFLSGQNLTTVENFLTPITTTSILVATPTYYNSVQPLAIESEFVVEYPNSATVNFVGVEKQIRMLIENYTQQKFGPYLSKLQMIQGNNGSNLSLYYPIQTLSMITDEFGQDLTSSVQISTVSPYELYHQPDFVYLDKTVIDYGFVDRKRDVSYRQGQYFTSRLNFFVKGDWGYYWIPDDVSEAARILLNDYYAGNLTLRSQGIQKAQLGDYSYQLGEIEGTTGNIYADRLLSGYVNINLGLA